VTKRAPAKQLDDRPTLQPEMSPRTGGEPVGPAGAKRSRPVDRRRPIERRRG
jgi:hypothetical protein